MRTIMAVFGFAVVFTVDLIWTLMVLMGAWAIGKGFKLLP